MSGPPCAECAARAGFASKLLDLQEKCARSEQRIETNGPPPSAREAGTEGALGAPSVRAPRPGSYSFHRGGRRVVGPVSLAPPAAPVLLVSGGNGKGKSTLLAGWAGLLPATDAPLAPPPPRPEEEGVLWVGQGGDCARGGTVGEALRLDALLLGGGGDAGAWCAAAAAHFSLGPSERVAALSAGRRRRLSLARTAFPHQATSARLWLLDEPLDGLDEEGEGALAAALAGHVRAGGGAVLAAPSGAGAGRLRAMLEGAGLGWEELVVKGPVPVQAGQGQGGAEGAAVGTGAEDGEREDSGGTRARLGAKLQAAAGLIRADLQGLGGALAAPGLFLVLAGALLGLAGGGAVPGAWAAASLALFALLGVSLSLDSLFGPEYENGRLAFLLLSLLPPGALATVRTATLFSAAFPGLAAASLVVAAFWQLPLALWPAWAAALGLGCLSLAALGVWLAALLLGARSPARLLGFVFLPLASPVLILLAAAAFALFGASVFGASVFAAGGGGFAACLLLLAAAACFYLPLCLKGAALALQAAVR